MSPTAGSDGSLVGIAWASASPPLPGWAARLGRCRRRAAATAAAAATSALGRDELERAGGAGAERLLDLRVADARGVVAGDDLDRGHPRLQPECRQGEQDEHSVAAAP